MNVLLALLLGPALGGIFIGDQCPQTAMLKADEVCPDLISRIAFGSCGEQNKRWPIINVTLQLDPDLFLFLGDNVYGDTFDMEVLQSAYTNLSTHSEFQALWKSTTRVLATWDDHDFGWNDAGKTYPFKHQSKDFFLDFFREPSESLRRQREGVYTSHIFGPPGKRVQVIMLDLRWFRDDLLPWSGELDVRQFYYERYYSVCPSHKQLVGEQQWAWLEEQLQKEAEVRLLCSSTQFGVEFNGYEAWANFPHELKRMQELIISSRAEGVVFLSGDVHYAELSRVDNGSGYPLFDLTSSGITSTWAFAAPNTNRIAGPVMENHMGFVDIDWQGSDTSIRLRIVNVKNVTRIDYTLQLSDLKFQPVSSA